MRRTLAVFLAALALMTAASCRGERAASGGDYCTFTDSLGAEVTLPERPVKVAVLFSSLADIWVSAGGEVDITVYESVERGFADGGAVLVDGGSGHSAIDLETLAEADPDLVIGTADYESQRKAADFCRTAGIPAALFRVESFGDYLGVLKIFCDITGKTENYTLYGSDVARRIEAILAAETGGGPEKEILFIRSGSSAGSTKAKTAADNFVCRMLDELGTANIADSEVALTGTLSLETVIERNPDCLFITAMGDETAAAEYMNSLLASEGWRELDCVKEGKYYFLPKELFHFKPNSRWAEAYEYLAELLGR